MANLRHPYKIATVALTALLLATFAFSSCCLAPPITGGLSKVSEPERDPRIVAAAKFAVAMHDRRLQYQGIEKAEQQVVAGLNFYITLKVSDKGFSRVADVVVWSDPSAKLSLTSWKWLK